MILYIKIVIFVVIIFSEVGFILPYLLSMADDLMVILGATNIFIAIPILGYLASNIFESFKKLTEHNK